MLINLLVCSEETIQHTVVVIPGGKVKVIVVIVGSISCNHASMYMPKLLNTVLCASLELMYNSLVLPAGRRNKETHS